MGVLKSCIPVLLATIVVIQGCGGTATQIEAQWETDSQGRWYGDVRILLPPHSLQSDIVRVAEQTLQAARQKGPVRYLAVNFTDTTVYYGASYNLARVEYSSPREGVTLPTEPGGLMVQWIWREKALSPDKARPREDDIRYYGLVWKGIIGRPLSVQETEWLNAYVKGRTALELERIFQAVQAWVYD